jgi:hypothetical protein
MSVRQNGYYDRFKVRAWKVKEEVPCMGIPLSHIW